MSHCFVTVSRGLIFSPRGLAGATCCLKPASFCVQPASEVAIALRVYFWCSIMVKKRLVSRRQRRQLKKSPKFPQVLLSRTIARIILPRLEILTEILFVPDLPGVFKLSPVTGGWRHLCWGCLGRIASGHMLRRSERIRTLR